MFVDDDFLPYLLSLIFHALQEEMLGFPSLPTSTASSFDAADPFRIVALLTPLRTPLSRFPERKI